MYNLAIALSLGLGTFAALSASHVLTPWESSLPGIVVFIVAMIALARRSFRQLEATVQQSSVWLQQRPPKIKQAMAALRGGYKFAPWQFGVRAQIDAQLGMLLFMTKEFAQARPLLSRAYLMSPWLAGAMLAVIQYKQKDSPSMRKTMAVVTRKAKKQGLAWNLYAYMLDQMGDTAGAVRVLAEGVRHAGHDTRVQESLAALSNGRKMKMRAYNEQWYQFQLERPPTVRQDASHMGRGVRHAQRGRW